MKHGLIALIDENMLVVILAPRGPLYEKGHQQCHGGQGPGRKYHRGGGGMEQGVLGNDRRYHPGSQGTPGGDGDCSLYSHAAPGLSYCRFTGVQRRSTQEPGQKRKG